MDNFDAGNLINAIHKLGTNKADSSMGGLELVAFEIKELRSQMEQANRNLSAIHSAIGGIIEAIDRN